LKIRYLAIEREFGSGGTEIAKGISANTGITCCGREIVEQTAAKLHMPIEEIEKNEENVNGSILYTIYMMAQAHSANSDMLTKEGQIFVAEQSVIRDLAKQGCAIFLGHCACEALKGEEGVIKVFIRCSDNAMRRERVIKEYGIPRENADHVMEQFDRKRANYFYANTGIKWKDFSKYDIVLDSAGLGISGCIGALGGLLLG
jgi:cytidylate kinase